MRGAAVVLCALALLGGRAEETRGAWRLTCGAAIVGGVRASIGADASGMRRASGFGSRIGGIVYGRGKEAAYADGAGLANGGRRVFDDGAWYDPIDAGENDRGYSWNWRLHDRDAADYDGFRGFVEYTSYHDITEARIAACDTGCADATEWMPGLRIEASRELYRAEGERPWGVDFAAAFAYYFERDLWKASGTAATASVVEREGRYEWRNDSHGEAQYILDYYRDTQFDGSMWGVGTFGGPGAELASDAWTYRTIGDERSIAHRLDYYARGSYREYAMDFLVRPWWEPWDWLRLFVSLGCEVSRREFRWSAEAYGTDGTRCAESGSARDWRLLGLCGGGVSARWRMFIVSAEALWRFAGDDLVVEGDTVKGKISNGDWGLRLSAGCEF